MHGVAVRVELPLTAHAFEQLVRSVQVSHVWPQWRGCHWGVLREFITPAFSVLSLLCSHGKGCVLLASRSSNLAS